jgi:hypothetical protein
MVRLDAKVTELGLTHGGSETGFFTKRRVVTHRFGKKPGFFESFGGSETGFLRKYLVVTRRFGEKPGFFGRCKVSM